MSFAALLVHPLAIVTPTVTSPAVVDDYGQPVRGTPTVRKVRGMVQPRTAREVASVQQGGAPYSSHVIFLEPIELSGAAYIRDDPSHGRRFDIVGIRSFEFGSAPHLEVDCNLVGQTEGPTIYDGS